MPLFYLHPSNLRSARPLSLLRVVSLPALSVPCRKRPRVPTGLRHHADSRDDSQEQQGVTDASSDQPAVASHHTALLQPHCPAAMARTRVGQRRYNRRRRLTSDHCVTSSYSRVRRWLADIKSTAGVARSSSKPAAPASAASLPTRSHQRQPRVQASTRSALGWVEFVDVHGPCLRSSWEIMQEQRDAHALAISIAKQHITQQLSQVTVAFPAAASISTQPTSTPLQLLVRSVFQSALISVELQHDASVATLSTVVAAALLNLHPSLTDLLQLQPSNMLFRHAACSLTGDDARSCSHAGLKHGDTLQLTVEGVGGLRGGSGKPLVPDEQFLKTKAAANAAFTAKRYSESVELYTECLKLKLQDPVILSN